MNMHDSKIDISTDFFCQEGPKAKHTCEKINVTNEELRNKEYTLGYDDLSFPASKIGLINITMKKEIDWLSNEI